MNLQIANYIIILEFWWNPQKLFQAMSRIDRRTQEKDIFIFLLCYNDYGEIIDEEEKYFQVMKNKNRETGKIYHRINETESFQRKECRNKEEEIAEKAETSTFSKSRKIPDVIRFLDRRNFLINLSDYLDNLIKNSHLPAQFLENISQNLPDTRSGKNYSETRNQIVQELERIKYQQSLPPHDPFSKPVKLKGDIPPNSIDNMDFSDKPEKLKYSYIPESEYSYEANNEEMNELNILSSFSDISNNNENLLPFTEEENIEFSNRDFERNDDDYPEIMDTINNGKPMEDDELDSISDEDFEESDEDLKDLGILPDNDDT
jgi:hypothetical protein